MHEFLDHPRPIPFAHRGGRDGHENTLESISGIRSQGYKYVEIDVRTTADGVPVLAHDRRVDGMNHPVARTDFDTLTRVARGQGYELAPLREVLSLWPDLRLSIDLKSGASVGPTVDAIRQSGASGRVCLTSYFESRTRQAAAALGDAVVTGCGLRSAALVWIARHLTPADKFPWRLSGRVIQLPYDHQVLKADREGFIDYLHALGLQVHYWTVNEEEPIRRLIDLGADGLITDDTMLLKRVLTASGRWVQ